MRLQSLTIVNLLILQVLKNQKALGRETEAMFIHESVKTQLSLRHLNRSTTYSNLLRMTEKGLIDRTELKSSTNFTFIFFHITEKGEEHLEGFRNLKPTFFDV